MFEVHKYAALTPEMSPEDFERLKADIKEHGQKTAIVVFEGKVLDGRHRLRACKELGIEPWFVTFQGDEEAAHRDSLRQNLQRRHVTPLQRAWSARKDSEAYKRWFARKGSHFDTIKQIADLYCVDPILTKQVWDLDPSVGSLIESGLVVTVSQLNEYMKAREVEPELDYITYRARRVTRGSRSVQRREAVQKCLETELRDAQQKLENATAELDLVQKLGDLDVPPIKPRKPHNSKRNGTAVMLASDWHVEKPVDPNKVNGLNEYSPEIAQRRSERYAQGVLDLMDMQRRVFDIRDAVLWLGGDFIEGYLRKDNHIGNVMPPLEATRFAGKLLASLIDTILANAPFIERLVIPTNSGNHGRTDEKPSVSSHEDLNFENNMYHALADRYVLDERVQFQIAAGLFNYLDIYDYKVRFMHGHTLKFGGGIGGIMIPINKAVARLDRGISADLTCMGHVHQQYFYGNVITNGSLIGWDDYASSIGASPERPKQAEFIIDAKEGPCSFHDLWVEPRR